MIKNKGMSFCFPVDQLGRYCTNIDSSPMLYYTDKLLWSRLLFLRGQIILLSQVLESIRAS